VKHEDVREALLANPEARREYLRLQHQKMGQLARALKKAHHSLTTLHGLGAFDQAAPDQTWEIDEAETLQAIDEALTIDIAALEAEDG
jgi:hypothetical protein